MPAVNSVIERQAEYTILIKLDLGPRDNASLPCHSIQLLQTCCPLTCCCWGAPAAPKSGWNERCCKETPRVWLCTQLDGRVYTSLTAVASVVLATL
jgi:hypothetical protein